MPTTKFDQKISVLVVSQIARRAFIGIWGHPKHGRVRGW